MVWIRYLLYKYKANVSQKIGSTQIIDQVFMINNEHWAMFFIRQSTTCCHGRTHKLGFSFLFTKTTHN